MRKTLSTVTAFMAAAILSASSTFAGTVTKNYDLEDFKTIEVSNFFDVTVMKASNFGVKVTVSEEYQNYLEVYVRNGELSIGFKNLPAKLSVVQVGKIAKAEVSLPSFEGVSLSGASKISSNDEFDLGQGVFNVSVSGTSNVNGLKVSAGEARFYVSGASKCSVTGDFVELHLNGSGTSRTEINANADVLEAMASGTAVMEINGDYDTVNVESSGVGNIKMTGKAEEIEISGSGTSGTDLTKMSGNSVKVELSGAAVAKVNAEKTLSVSLSAASKCSYIDNKGLKITEENVARAAKLTVIAD